MVLHRMLLVSVAIMVFSGTAWSGESVPIKEIDALLLERSQLEIQLLEERVARLRERALRLAQDIQRKDNTEGWELDLQNRKWLRPDPPKGK